MHSFFSWVIFHCVYVSQLSYPFICRWTSRLLPCPCYCKQCCNEHWGTRRFTYCWSLAWRILSITLLVCVMSVIMWYFEHSLALPFFRIGMKTDLFQSCGHCWVFQICWHIGCSTFTASSFRTWNSSAGIPSPPLALFVVMLRKVHLTLDSRMSGSRWMITLLWLSGSLRSFLYSSSLYSCHVLLKSCASVRSIPFLSFIEPIFAWNVPLVSLIFLKRSLVFPSLLFSSISLHCSLRKVFLCLCAILWNSTFRWLYLSFLFCLFLLLFSQLFIRPYRCFLKLLGLLLSLWHSWITFNQFFLITICWKDFNFPTILI